MHLKEAEAHERWLLAEERRLKLLATVLTERQNIIDEMKSIKYGLGSSKKKLREVVSPNCFGRDMGANLVVGV